MLLGIVITVIDWCVILFGAYKLVRGIIGHLRNQ